MDNLQEILVVEDDGRIQSVVEETLTEGGFKIVIASSGENAVELLDRSYKKYRALVTDINLEPGKLDDPDFPVVYMSGKDAADWASKGVPKSVMLARPFAPAQLGFAASQCSTARRIDRI